MNRIGIIAMLIWSLIIGAACAFTIEKPLPDAQQELRAKALFHEIRCVVCQSESVADSPADIAADIRRMIREQVAKGASDSDIKASLVSHYGDYILMKPPLNNATFLLWFGPALVLVTAFFVAMRFFRRSRRIRS